MYSGRSSNGIDWARYEETLGSSLPADYKEFCSVFPPGSFQEWLTVAHPSDGDGSADLDHTAMLVGMIRRAASRNDVPSIPLIAGPGGLIIWGYIEDSVYLCWLATSDDPQTWRTLITDRHASNWVIVEKSMTDVLYDILFGTEPLGPLESHSYLRESPIEFEPFDYAVAPVSADGEEMPVRYDGGPLRAPIDQAHAILATTGSTVAPVIDDALWDRLVGTYGVRIPADYRDLVSRLSPLSIRNIQLFVPSHSDPRHDWTTQLEKAVRDAADRRRSGRHSWALWPAAGGLFPWGIATTGELFCWLPYNSEPSVWPVAMVGYDGETVRLHNLSATAFLFEVLNGADPFEVLRAWN
ncbi:hypothetical protein [Cryptosporangium aurantiacum]|uniref:hypothetical protein n=1 Tax=Cryptosporangium aurantiacum TaxID=134849 RepID=UPI0011614073|nr:hypothetical protein [Cryptosporangium aurantiacum]